MPPSLKRSSSSSPVNKIQEVINELNPAAEPAKPAKPAKPPRLSPSQIKTPPLPKEIITIQTTQGAPARAKLEKFGLEPICEMVAEGMTVRQIAAQIQVSTWTMLDWIASSPARSARLHEVRTETAALWEQAAEQVLKDAKSDPVEMTRARELAHHYRWRASKLNPKDFGDKVDHTHRGSLGVLHAPMDLSKLTTRQLEAMDDVALTLEGTVIDADPIRD